MKKHYVALVSLIVVLAGCTISFSQIDTHGVTDQVGDEEQTATPNVVPTVNVPVGFTPSVKPIR
jgi:hypothetical protein